MHHIPSSIQEFSLFIVWFSVLVNAGGLPLPAYPVLMIAGALSASNGPSVVKILFTAATAALIADVGWYLAGVYVGRRLLAFFFAKFRFHRTPVYGRARIYLRE